MIIIRISKNPWTIFHAKAQIKSSIERVHVLERVAGIEMRVMSLIVEVAS